MTFDGISRRQFVSASTAGTAAFVAGCSFSYSNDYEGSVRGSETYEFEADEGEEIRVYIGNSDPDQEGASGTGELYAPDGQKLAEVSIDLSMNSSMLRGDEETVVAPATGTYEYRVDTNTDRLSVTVEVGDETIVD